MNYSICIPFVNRPDLLDRAVNSIPYFMQSNVIVLDNSPKRIVPADKWDHLEVEIPTVPLTFSQSLNFFTHRAIERNKDVMCFMHSDACAGKGTFEKLLALADPNRRHWGVIFTHYDALAAFNIEAMRDVGDWDVNLPWYYSDNDMYRRMRLAGWQTEDSGLPVEHTPSQTIKSDPELAFLNSVMFPLYGQYYRQRWGGDPGHESFTTPFNRAVSIETGKANA